MPYMTAKALLMASVLAFPVSALAQEATDTEATQPAAQLSEADAEFVNKAAADGQAEVDLGRLATEQGGDEQVKEFGQMMVDDHGKAGEELAQIAEQKSIELPAEPPAETKEIHDRLAGLSGAEFDHAYIDQMVEDHRKAIDLFQAQADSGADPELKAFAQQKLPTLQEHLARAEQIDMQITQQADAAPEAEDLSEVAPAAGDPAVQPADGTATQQAAVPSTFGQMRADEIIGHDVHNESGEEIGEIEDIVINTQDKAVAAIVSVGGFLGIGDKHVAVPFADLQPGANGQIVISGMTKEGLEQMPAYDEAAGGFEVYPRDQPLEGGQYQ